MSAIGPQLPPHLLENAAESEKHDEESELSEFKFLLGPQIPPGLLLNNVEAEEEDEDDYVPELPPDLLAQRAAGPSNAIASTSKRIVGPSMPSYPPTYDPAVHTYSDDDDDEEVGPRPLPAGVRHAEIDPVQQFMEKEAKRRKEVEEAAKPKTLKRDEWMLVPPTSSDLLGNLDPTKMKARQFSRSAAPAQKQTDNSLWTETPAERQQRLADEVSGKKRRAVDAKPDEEPGDGKKKRRRDEEFIRRGVEEYTQKIRGPALVAQHTSAGKGQEKDPNAGIWDHSRDMSLGGRLMDDEKRNKLVREAKGLGDRFGAGKGGGFL